MAPPRRRRSPPPDRPRVVVPPLFKAAMTRLAEQRARNLRTHFQNGRPYERNFGIALRAAVDQDAPSPSINGARNISGGAPVYHSARRNSASSPRGQAGRLRLSSALETKNRGDPVEQDQEEPRPAVAHGQSGGSTRSRPSTASPNAHQAAAAFAPPAAVDELNKMKNLKAAEMFLNDLSLEVFQRPLPPPLSEREPKPSLPTSPAPPLLPEIDGDSSSVFLTVGTAEEAHTAVAALFSGENMKIYLSPDMLLGQVGVIARILEPIDGTLLQNPALLAEKASQAAWLDKKINECRSEMNQLESFLKAPWLPLG